MAYKKIKQNWLPDDPVMPEHMNQIETQYEQVKADLETAGVTPSIDTKSTVQLPAPALPTNRTIFTAPIRHIFSWLFDAIRKIKGTTSWSDTLPTTLKDVSDHYTDTNPHAGVLQPYDINTMHSNKQQNMTAKIVASNTSELNDRQVRNIIISDRIPTAADGEEGDVWLVLYR